MRYRSASLFTPPPFCYHGRTGSTILDLAGVDAAATAPLWSHSLLDPAPVSRSCTAAAIPNCFCTLEQFDLCGAQFDAEPLYW